MPEEREKYVTLHRFLVQRQDKNPGASGELTRVLNQVGVVAKIISRYMRRAALEGLRGVTGETNVQGEKVKKLDQLGNSIFVEAFEYVDLVGALVSEEMEKPALLQSNANSAKYVVLFDPIDGSSNLDVDCIVGSIFSIRTMEGSVKESILRKGSDQVAAGYVIYGSSTLLVYTARDGVHSFVLDEQIGEFVLDHENLQMPGRGEIVCANFANYPRWSEPARAFADDLRRKKGYSQRYSGALVADLHQVLHRGGVYFYPEDEKHPEGKLRLLYECVPLALVAEQAGGAASTGKERVLDIAPGHTHQRIPYAVGSRSEIGWFEDAYGRKADRK